MLDLTTIINAMNAYQNDYPFRPVKCKEKDLENREPINGFLYFTTDTHKIFMGNDGEYIAMGGTSGIYYGKRQLTDDEKYGDDSFFTFYPTDIDSNIIPTVDDLILNIPDGGFYRVLDASPTIIETQRLVIAGGGGSGGNGNNNEGTLSINLISSSPQYASVIAGQDYYIIYDLIATDSAGDTVRDEGTATWKVNGIEVYTEKVRAGRSKPFNIKDYLDFNLDEDNVITVTVRMNTGGTRESIVSKKWYIKAIDLRLEWKRDYSENNYISTDYFNLSFTPSGGIDCTAHIIFDDNYEPNVTYFECPILAKETGKLFTTKEPMKSLSYGAHKCEIYLTATINGQLEKTVSTIHELTFIKDGTSSILTVPYYQTVAQQYDSLKIPFMVYDPDQDQCNVSFYVNDIKITSDSYDRSLQFWPYTLTEYGTIKLSIRTDNGDDSKDIELIVNSLALDAEEVGGYAFSLKANNFSSNEELKNWNYRGVNLDFSPNFDWKNGGLKFETKEDGSIEKYICVRQGTWMQINYNLFDNATTDTTDSGGKTFKFAFKATNCYDYEAPILECYDEANNVGLKFDAQKATFSTNTIKNFSTQYYENSYIELETEIWPDVNDPDAAKKIYGDRFIMFWVDGVPAGVKPYSKGEKFTHINPKPIKIGSDYCDVYVYVAKAYEKRLTEDNHINNFIADAPSAAMMVDRYNRNDILDNAGEISYSKLINKNPNCHVYMYEIPRMTQNKDNKIDGCTYAELYKDNNTLTNPYYSATDVQTYVQGTSSAAYGVAAFNLRSKFKKGLINSIGDAVNGWSVSNNAIPIDLTCTKVNVASCENVNNVINQEWYNKFQPYHDAHRRKLHENGKTYRDTMEFNSGVLFIKDNNPETNYRADDGAPSRDKYLAANVFADTSGYTNKPYYKQYAIANMGNDKKNVEVFHDTKNPKACCVEVTDNQNAEHWMTIPVDMNNFTMDEPYHEFRYPDGNDKATLEQKQAWITFVNWMAHNDPSPYNEKDHPYGYTGEDLEAPVEYEAYTFKGFDPPGYEGQPNPTGVSLKGTTILPFENLHSTRADGTKYIRFEKDTHEYRIMKMLHECEEHLVMDSVVYHYLFILRHTMVDNVAKNTFWSSEDLVHWDLTKDYDNDTSDGNDNSGYLSFTYGLEFGDLDSTGGKVFNADSSVWINFIHELEDAQQELYTQLDNLPEGSAWAPEAYLNACLAHQNNIPERCWIYDYFRKYIRPRRLGLDEDTYLKRLEGGKKVHQRAQYEKYQHFYIGSKYISGPQFNQSSAVNLRLNSDDTSLLDKEIPTSYYIDCYSSLKVGGRTHRSGRITRGQKYNIPIGEILSNSDDGTCYIYGANMIQTMENLAAVYPNEADFNNTSKLRTLSLGSDIANYRNTQLTSVNISGAQMLEDVQIQNCGVLTGALNPLILENTHQLQSLKINGSTFSGLTLPQNSIIHTLYLNPVSSLSMINATHLNEVLLDDGIYDPWGNGKITNGIYDTLSDATVINCPKMDEYTYRFAKGNVLQYYTFTDITWVITDIDDLTLDAHNNVIAINVLDTLLTKIPNSGKHSTSLSGIVTIDVTCNVDEYEIYEKYAAIYPNLTLAYSDKVNLNAAVKLKFYTNKDNTTIHYQVLGNGETAENGGINVATLISAEGPLKEAITTPNKEPSNSETYTFSGYWVNKADQKKYYLPGTIIEPIAEATSFADLIPVIDMEFYPDYIIEERKYSVRFYDDKAILIPQIAADGTSYDEWLVSYNTAYNGPMKEYYYKNSNDLTEYDRYTFVGWSKRYYNTEIDEIPDIDRVILSDLIVKNNITLYACYKIEDVRESATDMQYFEFTTINDKYGEGQAISLKNDYKTILEGKITLPSTIDGKKIISIYDFQNTTKITHIFFLRDAEYYSVYDKGFQNSTSLISVDLPSTIRKIGDYAFAICFNLEKVTLNDNITHIGQWAFSPTNEFYEKRMKTAIDKLPDNLEELGAQAFCYGGDNIKINSLPPKLKALYAFTFNTCPNVCITDFGSNDGSAKLWYIASHAMANCGKNFGGKRYVNIYHSIEAIAENAFADYLSHEAHYNFYRFVDSQGNTDYYASIQGDAVNYQGDKSHPNIAVSGGVQNTVSMGIHKVADNSELNYTYITP